MWPLRRRFWNFIATLKFRSNKPAVIQIPGEDPQKLKPVAFASQFPDIPISNILVADRVPADEASLLKFYFYKFQVGMYSLFSPMQSGLPQIDSDPQKALDGAYTSSHRRCFPLPVLPDEYKVSVDLGRLAVASPYACYVKRATDDGYHWDWRALDGYERHSGLRSLGARVLFQVNQAGRRLEAARIDCELGSCRPGDSGWDLARKIALCAATTHLSLVRHFNWVHLACGAPLAIATRN